MCVPVSSARSLPRRTESAQTDSHHPLARTRPVNAAQVLSCVNSAQICVGTRPLSRNKCRVWPAPCPVGPLTASGTGEEAALGPVLGAWLPFTGDSPWGSQDWRNVRSALVNFLSFTKSHSPL